MRAQLTITIEDDGRINVNGPINDKLLSYGMLECARDAIKDHAAKNQQRIQLVPGDALPPRPPA
jgi:hypothetical protein